MARTAIAIQEILPQSHAAITFNSADAVNNNMFDNDGKTVLVVRNPTGGALNASVISVADEHGRTGDVTNQSIAASEVRVFGPFRQRIWNQIAADLGKVYVNCASGLQVAALKLNIP